MKTIKILLIVLFIVFSSISIYIFFGPFQLKNPTYLVWVYFGEECSDELLNKYVFEDPAKFRIIHGLSEEKIRKRFHNLVDSETYPLKSYRREVFESYKNSDEYKGKRLKMLWFDGNAQGMGWVIILVDDRGERFDPMKG